MISESTSQQSCMMSNLHMMLKANDSSGPVFARPLSSGLVCHSTGERRSPRLRRGLKTPG